MKLEGQIQGLNLYGLEDNKAFFTIYICECGSMWEWKWNPPNSLRNQEEFS